MPVTAKLSRRFYETFGDEIANELVDWFNQVDLTYRTELWDLNEANFAKVDAKLTGLRSEVDAKLAELKSELLKWMFLFWVGNVATTIGVAVAVVGMLKR